MSLISIAYFSTFLHEFCKWQVSMTFGCWTVTLLSWSWHCSVSTNVPCCESCHLIFVIHDTSSYHWWFKCDSAMNQVELLAGGSHTGHITSSCMMSSQMIKMFASITPHRAESKLWLNYHCLCLATTHLLICNLTYPDHSSGQSGHLTWPKFKFSNWPFRFKIICFYASWCREYYGVSLSSLPFLVLSYL